MIQAPTIIHRQDTVGVSYSQSTGNTLASDSVELRQEDQAFADPYALTKRARFTLRDKAGNIVANETVKAMIIEYATGNVLDLNWGLFGTKASVTTDGNGLFDMAYTGSITPGGGTVYVAVIRTSESLVWNIPLV